ncbi:peptide/nickel transport system ATP-binding protein/oligopeptide transport system ATP-binding protein [Orenia metallireducens]|uniref:Peptide/nickel transport system ATP-binding protein/oligopeptide transport system ATP-binding protein n=1 Tax=Orenia metallireducens TaxID=1413210 RepID=A0A285G187_9FIRM|nr:ABC transporter ATP-binding protein [Orenia metallireducens]PRX31793.1 peptide/nickel transport system ATP-binding protein/oligopeptide transport system ATP-binding protein [Orenia metallireducens]SNY17309.1 peptide/nickel transport system ATP-binding protein/oligopeptide transport system ATP-binding protein [Orenia metallireducens]
MEKDIILEINNLKTYFDTDNGIVKACDGVSYQLNQGKTLAVVGESGSGKSVTALSILKLIPSPPGKIVDGEINFKGINLLKISKEEMEKIRGNEIAMIFQEPMTSLNPALTIGYQIREALLLHQSISKKEANQRAIELLNLVGIPSPDQRVSEYPHQISGGMRQRVMIAIALACNPKLLIADEPTTALDVTIQAQILRLIKRLQQELEMSVIMITHDLGVVAEVADTVAVMYAGKIVEYGLVDDIFYDSKHPYLKGLKKSIPRLDIEQEVLHTIKGVVPSSSDLPAGCKFEPRCSYSLEICKFKEPKRTYFNDTHYTCCWLYQKDGENLNGE